MRMLRRWYLPKSLTNCSALFARRKSPGIVRRLRWLMPSPSEVKRRLLPEMGRIPVLRREIRRGRSWTRSGHGCRPGRMSFLHCPCPCVLPTERFQPRCPGASMPTTAPTCSANSKSGSKWKTADRFGLPFLLEMSSVAQILLYDIV